MARAFTSGSNLTVSSAILSGVPLTLSAWFNANNLTATNILLGLFKTGVTPASAVEAFYLSADGASAGDSVVAVTATTPSIFAVAASTAGFSAGVWSHACGVFAASNSRTAYFNGANPGSETTNVVPAGLDRTYVGQFEYGGGFIYSDCSIAECAIWNVALNADEVASLARGFSPMMVRPASLAWYLPIMGRVSPEPDLKAGNNAAIIPGTTIEHPRMIYPAAPYILDLPAVAPSGPESLFHSGVFQSSVFREAA